MFFSLTYGHPTHQHLRNHKSNSMKSVSIIPIEYVKNKPLATKLEVSGMDNFSDSCQIQWALKDASDNLVYRGSDVLDGTAYANWDGTNDYPVTFICQKNGLTLNQQP